VEIPNSTVEISDLICTSLCSDAGYYRRWPLRWKISQVGEFIELINAFSLSLRYPSVQMRQRMPDITAFVSLGWVT
jgi:hypothetical protein